MNSPKESGISPASANPASANPASIDPPSIDPPSIDPPSIDPPSIDPPSIDPPSIDPPSIDPPSADRALNTAVETHTRTELRRQAHKVSANLRELADRIERAGESLDQIASGESVTSYADVAAEVQRQVVVTLYNTPLHVLTQLASEADAARALATREDGPS